MTTRWPCPWAGRCGTAWACLPEQRAEVVAALEAVDYVVIFDELDPLQVIARLVPDVLIKGGDWTPDTIIGRDIVEAAGGSVFAIPLMDGVSTTVGG